MPGTDNPRGREYNRGTKRGRSNDVPASAQDPPKRRRGQDQWLQVATIRSKIIMFSLGAEIEDFKHRARAYKEKTSCDNITSCIHGIIYSDAGALKVQPLTMLHESLTVLHEADKHVVESDVAEKRKRGIERIKRDVLKTVKLAIVGLATATADADAEAKVKVKEAATAIWSCNLLFSRLLRAKQKYPCLRRNKSLRMWMKLITIIAKEAVLPDGKYPDMPTAFEGYAGMTLEKSEMVHLLHVAQATTIGDSFLRGSLFSSINLSRLRNITKIGRHFLHFNQKLTSIDLSCLTNVTEIGESSLSACVKLESVKLSGMEKLRTVGEGFLFMCRSLTLADLSGLGNLQSLTRSFMSVCPSLSTINLSGLTSVTVIGDDVFSECSSLKSVDLTGLEHVATIGDALLSNCAMLETVDMSSMKGVGRIGDRFLYKCTNMKTLRLADASYASAVTSAVRDEIEMENIPDDITIENIENIPHLCIVQ